MTQDNDNMENPGERFLAGGQWIRIQEIPGVGVWILDRRITGGVRYDSFIYDNNKGQSNFSVDVLCKGWRDVSPQFPLDPTLADHRCSACSLRFRHSVDRHVDHVAKFQERLEQQETTLAILRRQQIDKETGD